MVDFLLRFSPYGGGGPFPRLEAIWLRFSQFGVLSATFSPCRGLFAIIFSKWGGGHFLSLWGTFSVIAPPLRKLLRAPIGRLLIFFGGFNISLLKYKKYIQLYNGYIHNT